MYYLRTNYKLKTFMSECCYFFSAIFSIFQCNTANNFTSFLLLKHPYSSYDIYILLYKSRVIFVIIQTVPFNMIYFLIGRFIIVIVFWFFFLIQNVKIIARHLYGKIFLFNFTNVIFNFLVLFKAKIKSLFIYYTILLMKIPQLTF